MDAVSSSNLDERLVDYRRLLEKAAAKFDEIRGRRQADFACARGCSACCAPGLSVFPVERENLRAHAASRPELEARLRELEAANPHAGTRCAFLDAAGACSVYEARPLICRTHGAPVFFRDGEDALLDVCPENFIGGLEGISASDAINLDLLNGLLALVNQRFVGGPPELAGARTPLAPSAILARE